MHMHTCTCHAHAMHVMCMCISQHLKQCGSKTTCRPKTPNLSTGLVACRASASMSPYMAAVPSAASRCTYCTPQPSDHASCCRILGSLPRRSVSASTCVSPSVAGTATALRFTPAVLRFWSSFSPFAGVATGGGSGSVVVAAALCSRCATSAAFCLWLGLGLGL